MRAERLWMAAAALLLTSCATLSETECRSVDWFDLGVRDGTHGYSESRLDEHRQSCSEHGLATDAAAWRQGHVTGLESYCTVDNGYHVGRRGLHYGRVCPAAAEREFLAAYELGRETYDVEQEMADLDRRIESLESRLARSDGMSNEERQDTRRYLAELYRQMGWLRRSRDRLEFEWRRRF